MIGVTIYKYDGDGTLDRKICSRFRDVWDIPAHVCRYVPDAGTDDLRHMVEDIEKAKEAGLRVSRVTLIYDYREHTVEVWVPIQPYIVQ